MMTSSRGFEVIPREIISVVAPAGGWLTPRRTINAPVAVEDLYVANNPDPRTVTLTAEEQKIADSMSAKITDSVKAEMTWDKLEPIYVEIYQKSFTQEELSGTIAFYKTPAGVALVKKMPVVMQQSMIAMQQFMGPIMQRVEASIKETADAIEAKK